VTPLDNLHVPLVDRVVGTWGDQDGRWHTRVAVLAKPAVLSVPGLYEAPEKPGAYYGAEQFHALRSGGPPPREVLEGAGVGRFPVADDTRASEALEGYPLAAYL